jgi:hypothetical protein
MDTSINSDPPCPTHASQRVLELALTLMAYDLYNDLGVSLALKDPSPMPEEIGVFTERRESVFNNVKKIQNLRKSLAAMAGIEHAIRFASKLRNSQQHKPLRSFLNVFKPLKRVFSLQELYETIVVLFPTHPPTIAT